MAVVPDRSGARPSGTDGGRRRPRSSHGEGDRVIGFAQFLGDGEITVYLASIAVAADSAGGVWREELVTYGFGARVASGSTC